MFLIGGNPASNHPRLMTALMKVRRRGGQVIVINPIVELGLVNFRIPSDLRSLLFGSPIASLYLQPHIGGDLALLTGIAKRSSIWTRTTPSSFASTVAAASPGCSGSASSRGTSWSAKSGCRARRSDAIGRRVRRAQNAIFSWTMGITHHEHGVQNVQAIANLALLRGMVGDAQGPACCRFAAIPTCRASARWGSRRN